MEVPFEYALLEVLLTMYNYLDSLQVTAYRLAVIIFIQI